MTTRNRIMWSAVVVAGGAWSMDTLILRGEPTSADAATPSLEAVSPETLVLPPVEPLEDVFARLDQAPRAMSVPVGSVRDVFALTAPMRSQLQPPPEPDPLAATPQGNSEEAKEPAPIAPGSEPIPVLVGVLRGRIARAIVNDKVVAVGDSIGDYRVRSIGADRVVLERDGEVVELELRPGNSPP